MINKFTNLLMVLIIIVIIVFGGIYYYKMQNMSKSYALEPDVNKVQDINDVHQVVHSNSTTSENDTQVIIPSINTNSLGMYNTDGSGQNEKYKYNNRYYYNQLDNYSKALYQAVENNLDELKYGTCNINIDYDFSSILQNTDDKYALKPYYDDAIDALSLDIPDLFYIDFSKLRLFVETKTNIFGTKYKIYLGTKEGESLYKEGFSSKAQVDTALNQINAVKNNLVNIVYANDYHKIREAHDWIIENVSYDDDEIYKSDVYGTLIDKRAVCEGYARTYKCILDELGINNILATGIATNSEGNSENHMWNYVLLNNNWYAVDVTWDDPIIVGGGVLSNATKHRYFLLGSKKFFENHTEEHVISSQGRYFALPTLNTKNYE